MFFKNFIIGICFLAIELIAAEQTITICGTGDSQQLLRSLSQVYELKYPGTKIVVPQSIGSGGGIKNTAAGTCDLGRVARKIKEKEKEYNLTYILFAYSPIVFVTNENLKSLTNLNENDILGIFTGEIKQWEQFKNTGKIYPVTREPSDSSQVIIKNTIGIEFFTGKVIFSTPETIDIITRHKNTIGYTSLAAAMNHHLNILNFNSVAPNEENILNKSYTLVLPFGFVYKGKLNTLSKSFIEFVRNQEAKSIIDSNGAVQALE